MSPCSICLARTPRILLLGSQLPGFACRERRQPWGSLLFSGRLGLCGTVEGPASCRTLFLSLCLRQLIVFHHPGVWEAKSLWCGCGLVSAEKIPCFGGRTENANKDFLLTQGIALTPFNHVSVEMGVGERTFGEVKPSAGLVTSRH